MAKKSRLKIAQEIAQKAIDETNTTIEILGEHTSNLHDSLVEIQDIFDEIRNIPTDKKLEYENLKKIRLNWKQQAEKIEKDFKTTVAKDAGAGTVGVSLGVAASAMGPTVAMGVATTFGVASTGTAISALSGAAATNAALAWLGGGALAAGGGGMAAGQAFLAMTGPIGWSIAGVALVTSGIFLWLNQNNKKRMENVYTLISERDVKYYDLATVEINERITRIDDEYGKLNDAIELIKEYGTDYNNMSESQQYELGSYVNLMHSSTQLLTNPILGLQPKFSEKDLDECLKEKKNSYSKGMRNLLISLANLFYKIKLDDKDKKLLWKSLRKNKKFLKSMDISKREFDISVMYQVEELLNCKYRLK